MHHLLGTFTGLVITLILVVSLGVIATQCDKKAHAEIKDGCEMVIHVDYSKVTLYRCAIGGRTCIVPAEGGIFCY